ncbi:hypothetical protein [Okeania sp. SIO3B5]|nr:hypothetical protein [Okeania sp. SIO3B5]
MKQKVPISDFRESRIATQGQRREDVNKEIFHMENLIYKYGS